MSLLSGKAFMEVFKLCGLILFLQISGGIDDGEGIKRLENPRQAIDNEGELVEHLLSNYHKHGRPVLDVSICVSKECSDKKSKFIAGQDESIDFFFKAKKPINVTLGATLQQIIKVDPNEETLTAMFW